MLVKAFVHEVVCAGSEVIARHVRSYEREDMIFNPLHLFGAAWSTRSNALDQAAPLAWHLPEGFAQLRWLMEARLGRRASASLCRRCDYSYIRTRGTNPGRRRPSTAGRDLVRRCEAPAAVPDRAASGAAGPGELSAPAVRPRRHYRGPPTIPPF